MQRTVNTNFRQQAQYHRQNRGNHSCQQNRQTKRYGEQVEHVGGEHIKCSRHNMEQSCGVIHQGEANRKERVKDASDDAVYEKLGEQYSRILNS